MSDEVTEYFDRAEELRSQHRVMTWAEYQAWCRAGDGISFPSEAHPFPGGLTIKFGGNPILGTTTDPPQ